MIDRMTIGEKILSAEEAKALLTSGPSDSYKEYTYEVELDSGGPDMEDEHGCQDVVIESTLYKEMSDNEVFGNYYPSMRLNVNIRVNVPGLVFGVRTLALKEAVPVYENKDGAFSKYELGTPMLPNDSVIFWWRSAADDGEPVEHEGDLIAKPSSAG